MNRCHLRLDWLLLVSGLLCTTSVRAEPDLDRLLAALRDSDGYKVRLQAAVLLGQHGDTRAVTPLIATLSKDSESLVRAAAAAALGKLGDPSSIGALVRQQVLDNDTVVRQEATLAVARFDRTVLVAPLARVYDEAEEAPVRQQTVHYLGAIEREPRADAVLRNALGDASPAVAAEAQTAILHRPEDAALSLLQGALDDRSASVRRGAVRALGATGSRTAAQAIIGVFERDVEVEEVRREAEGALRRLRAQVPLAAIVAEARTSPLKHARARALKILGIIGGNEAREVLVQALVDDDVYVRGNAVMAIATLGDASLVPTLEKMAGEASNKKIAHLVQRTLARLRGEEAPGAP